jgi:hypothetical protein
MAFFSFLYGRDEEEEKKVNESAKKKIFDFDFFSLCVQLSRKREMEI